MRGGFWITLLVWYSLAPTWVKVLVTAAMAIDFVWAVAQATERNRK